MVIADDLTGANEVATLMVKKRKRSLVLNTFLKDNEIRNLWESYEGLAFNLSSRNLPEEMAYNKSKDFLTFSEGINRLSRNSKFV